jgi:iron complex outermembrane recepter protein
MKLVYPLSLAIIFACASPAMANPQNFNIPADRLDIALIQLAQQSGISIGGVDSKLAAVRSRGVRGKMQVSRALNIMLKGTGFDFVAVDATTYRIIRQIVKPLSPVAKRGIVRPADTSIPLTARSPEPEIIVTGSKQSQLLDTYAGTVHVQKVGIEANPAQSGTSALVERIPTLASTNLGPGRNKVFVRGIADSSFSGPTQSTVGLYLGDMRVTYSEPDPDLPLVDIDKIEVLEGPQGTLYGAGSLGGVIRLVPKSPDLNLFQGDASVGVATTKSGAVSFDSSAVVNVPLISDKIALRVVGYGQTDGGYIDDVSRRIGNVNTAKIRGARAYLRIQPDEDWTIDLGVLLHNIRTRDNQYAETDLPKLSQAAKIAQPQENSLSATSLVLNRKWGGVNLVSSTSFVKHGITERFDATGYDGLTGKIAYDSANNNTLFNHETRLSGNAGNSSWVVGVFALNNVAQTMRTIGPLAAPLPLANLTNENLEFGLFTETTQHVASNWNVTLGARLQYSKSAGELIGEPEADFEPRATRTRVLPTMALSWKPLNNVIGFLRYRTGFRNGGVGIDGGGLNTGNRFASDRLDTYEIGVRFGGADTDRSLGLSGGLTASYSNWRAIQADLISAVGLPYTANVGRGRIAGLEGNLIWRPTDRLTLDGSFFVNDSALVDPSAEFEDAEFFTLPNVAKAGGHAGVTWTYPLPNNHTLQLDGAVRYIGMSNLSAIPPLLLRQGGLFQSNLSATLNRGNVALSLNISNVLNASGNSFSYGNPFSVGLGKQTTPLRPRTARVGVTVRF